MDKVTVIFADTYKDSYGSTIELFGIATSEEKIDEICKRVVSEGYYPETINMTMDEYCNRYLGGYYE